MRRVPQTRPAQTSPSLASNGLKARLERKASVKLPSRLSIALGTLVAGLVALSLEVSMSHPLHVVCGLVGAFVLFLIHPAEAGTIAPAAARPESARAPDGATPATAPPGL
jgi:hypothetical protein